MDNQNMKRALFLKECRESKKLNKAELARLLHFSSRTTIIRWEKGESFPDEQTLLSLSKIFDVSVEDLRAGEKIGKKYSVIQNKDFKFLFPKKLFNIYSLFFCFLFFLIIIFSFIMCFYYKKDKAEVYKLSLDSSNFIIDNSTLILSKDISTLNLNKVESKNEEEIKNIRLYFSDADNEERIIISGCNDNIYIEEKYGYNEYNLYELKSRDLYIEIKTDKNVYDKIKIDKTFVNEFNYFFKKKNVENIANVSENIEINLFNIDKEFLLNQDFIYEEEIDSYVKNINDKYYFFIDDRKISLSIYSEDNYRTINLDAFSDYDNYLYTEYYRNEIVETYEIVASNEKNCSIKKCSDTSDYIQYITYLKNHL